MQWFVNNFIWYRVRKLVKCLVHLKYLNHVNYDCGNMAFIGRRHVDYDVNRHGWLLWYWLQNISQLWINHQLQLLCENLVQNTALLRGFMEKTNSNTGILVHKHNLRIKTVLLTSSSSWFISTISVVLIGPHVFHSRLLILPVNGYRTFYIIFFKNCMHYYAAINMYDSSFIMTKAVFSVQSNSSNEKLITLFDWYIK